MTAAPQITIVDVGPRDGFQPIETFIPTARKLDIIDRLYAAGLRRMEVSAFVSPTAVPQLADAAEVLSHAQRLGGLKSQVLVPSLRYAEKALSAGATHLAFVVSVSEKHNLNNVRRTPLESVAEYGRIVAMLPENVELRLNLATAFDCPFDGRVAQDRTLDLMARLIEIRPEAEICPCDTTGRVAPDHVGELLATAQARFPHVQSWAYHGHDTYGLGVANVLAAWRSGVTVIDSSVGGLGGCPFAPGATGNVATEDVVWTFERMNVETGVDLQGLLGAADEVAGLPGARPGGRVRDAINASLCLAS